MPAADEFVEIGAAIGVVLLLLTLGLEFSLGEFVASGRRHVRSAVVDLVLNATPGAVVGWLVGLSPLGVLALAGATWVSSSGIIARLLTDLGRLGNRETPAVLSVLVLEDFAMAAYLPLLTVLAAGGTWWQAGLGVLLAVGAVAVAFVASRRWGHQIGRLLSHPEPEQLMLRVLGTTLLVAGLAELVGASAAVGAFLVGLTLTGVVADRARAVLAPLRDLFAAAFFLAIGFAVDVRALLPLLPAALALAAVTAVTKVLTGAYAASRDGVGRRGRLRAGTALIPRGEFSIVILAWPRWPIRRWVRWSRPTSSCSQSPARSSPASCKRRSLHRAIRKPERTDGDAAATSGAMVDDLARGDVELDLGERRGPNRLPRPRRATAGQVARGPGGRAVVVVPRDAADGGPRPAQHRCLRTARGGPGHRGRRGQRRLPGPRARRRVDPSR